MRTLTRTLSGLALMLAVGFAGAQQPGQLKPDIEAAPKKSALEEALDLALKNNPDLRVAASRLALAEAELSRTRLQVTQKVAAAYADVLTQRAILKEIERQFVQTRTLVEKGGATRDELTKAEMQVGEIKAKVAAAERELDHLQGKGGRDLKVSLSLSAGTDAVRYYGMMGHPASANSYRFLSQEGTVRVWQGVSGVDLLSAKTEGSDKLRQALQKKVTQSGQKVSLTDYLALVKKIAGVGIQANAKGPAWEESVDFDFKDVTIGGMLQFLEDNLTGHQILVREYGLLVVAKEKVPTGAVTLTAFLHTEPAKPAADKKPAVPSGTTPQR